MKFSKKHFSTVIHERINNLISLDTIEVAVSIICDTIINHVVSEDRLIIDGFGVFSLSKNKDNISIKFLPEPRFQKKINKRAKRLRSLDTFKLIK